MTRSQTVLFAAMLLLVAAVTYFLFYQGKSEQSILEYQKANNILTLAAIAVATTVFLLQRHRFRAVSVSSKSIWLLWAGLLSISLAIFFLVKVQSVVLFSLGLIVGVIMIVFWGYKRLV